MTTRPMARAMALVAVLVLGSPTQGAQQPLQDLLASAQTLADRAEYSNLLELSAQIIAAYPASSEAYRFRGLAKRNLKDVGGAMIDYDRAIELDQSNVRAWRGRGATKRGAGDLRGALADLDRAVAIAPADATGYDVRSEIRFDLKDIAGAIDDETRSITIAPGVAATWVRRGYYKDEAGDRSGAEEDYTKAISLDPNYGMAWFNRAGVRRQRQDIRGSLDDYQKTLDLGHNPARAHYGRALTHELAGSLEAAVEDVQQSLALEPGFALAQSLLERLRERAKTAPRTPPTPPPGNVPVITKGTKLAPAPFGIVTVSTSGVSKTPADPAADPAAGALWTAHKPVPTPVPPVAPIDIPPTLEFSNLSMSLYNWSVTTAKEGMRVVIGPMSPDQETRFEAKWAPYYDAPSFEVVEHLNSLNPLLARFIAARSGFVHCAREAGKAMVESAALSEAKRHRPAEVAMESAHTYKRWMDAYDAAMRLALADIDKLGPMPNPYAERRKRAKRLQEEVDRLAPVGPAKPSTRAGDYWVLSKLEKSVPTPTRPNEKVTVAEGLATLAAAGKVWFIDSGTMNVTARATWTPFPRVVKATEIDKPSLIALSASASVSFNDIPESRITGWQLREKLGLAIHVGSGESPSQGDVYASARANGARASDKGECDLNDALRRAAAGQGNGPLATLFLTVQTGAEPIVFRYEYKRASLTADQAAELKAKGDQEIASLGGAQQEAARVGEENAAKVSSLQFLMDSRRLFDAERKRAREDLNAAAANDPARKELEMRFLYADSQAQATTDALNYANTGQWVRTRTLYDDYDFHNMIEIGRKEAERIAGPAKALKAGEAQIDLAPEFMRTSLREQLRKGLTSDMMRGRNPEGLRALVTSMGGQVRDYWIKQEGRESFKATIANVAEEGTKMFAGVAIVGAGSLYVAGLGVTGAALWATDTLIGAAYGGVSGYVEGGPDDACRKSLEWAGLLGFAASSAIQSYSDGADVGGVLSAAGRAVVFAKTFEYAGAFAAGFFARPTVAERFALAKFNQEMEWGGALIGRSQRAEAALATGAASNVTGEALARLRREMSEATAAVNGSWHAKVLLKYGVDEVPGRAFTRRVEALYDEVMPDFEFNLRAMGYNADQLHFTPCRNPESAGTVGMDLDLALLENSVIMRNGQRIHPSAFQRDAQKAYNQAYFARTGYSAEQSLINITTSAHVEAFTARMRSQSIYFSSLTTWDRQRASEVLLTKVTGLPLDGFTRAVEAARALEKELGRRFIPDLRTQAIVALAAGNRAQANRLTASADYWEDIRRRTAFLSGRETDAYGIWTTMQELQAWTGGKDIFELTRTLSAYWPALGSR